MICYNKTSKCNNCNCTNYYHSNDCNYIPPCPIIVATGITGATGTVLSILGIISFIYTAKWETKRRSIDLIYEFDGNNSEYYEKIITAFNKFSKFFFIKLFLFERRILKHVGM